MNKIIIFGIIFLLMIGVVNAIPDEWGRGMNSDGDVTFREGSFLDGLFSLFAITGLQGSYQAGQTVTLRTSQNLLYGKSCSGNLYIVLEVYDASKYQQTTSNYCGNGGGCSYDLSSSFKVASNVNSYSGNWIISFTLPSDIYSGTWSISSYLWCQPRDPQPANQYSSVNEENFNVVGQATCINECSSGNKICISKHGYRSRYIARCGNYDSDSCLEYATSDSDLTDCGGIDRCENGVCIGNGNGNGECTLGQEKCVGTEYWFCDTNKEWVRVPTGDIAYCINGNGNGNGATQPNILVISTDISKVDDGNQVEGTITLKNTGASMTENYVVEMQVISGTEFFAVVAVPEYQANCNTDTLANVHSTFKLNSGEQKTIKLISPQEGVISKGTWKVAFFVVKKCFLDDPTGDRTVPGIDEIEPIGEKRITITAGTIVCGDGKCDESEKGICLKDCRIECNLDGICDGAESCTTCDDCETEANPGSSRCFQRFSCAKSLPSIEIDYSILKGINCITNPLKCGWDILIGKSPIKIRAEEERCATSLTKDQFKKATDEALLDSVCSDSRECELRTDYIVECVREETVGVSVPKKFTEELEIAFGAPTKGLCLATPIEEPGFDISAEKCIMGLCLPLYGWLIGGVMIFMVFMSMIGNK